MKNDDIKKEDFVVVAPELMEMAPLNKVYEKSAAFSPPENHKPFLEKEDKSDHRILLEELLKLSDLIDIRGKLTYAFPQNIILDSLKVVRMAQTQKEFNSIVHKTLYSLASRIENIEKRLEKLETSNTGRESDVK